jgi:hypothetical protein
MAGLRAKRDEILSEIDRLEGFIAGLRADLSQIDAVVGILNRVPASYAPRTARKRLFQRGETGRIVFAALRRSERPLSTREIVALVAAQKGEDVSDPVVVSSIMNRLGKSLAKYRQRGDLLGERRGNMTYWRLPYDRPEA